MKRQKTGPITLFEGVSQEKNNEKKSLFPVSS